MSLITKLSSLQTSLGLLPAGDGAFTLKEGGVFVHSSRAPMSEAARLIEGSEGKRKESHVFILWGMGLGYHAELLLEKGFTVIGIELRPKCIQALKASFPLESLHAFITENPEEHIFSALTSLLPEQAQDFTDVLMRGCSPSPSTSAMEEKAKRAQRSSNRIYSHLMDSWHRHILTNLALTPKLAVFSEKYLEGLPLIICSAGPSLKESLPYIAGIRKKVVLIAVDTALTALIEAGIIPDFLHAVDAKLHNIGDFSGISDEVFSQIYLLADLTLSPIVYEKPWKGIEILMTVHPLIHPKKGFHLKSIALLEHLRAQGLKICSLQTGGSVATSAFHYAAGHSAGQILLAGQDLAYSDNRGHSVGTPYDKEYRCAMNRLKPLDTIHLRKIPPDAFMAPGIGGSVPVDPLLAQFRSWFETSLADPANAALQKRCINASENGAVFHAWPHKKLSQISEELSAKKDISLPLPALIDNPYLPLVLKSLSLWGGGKAESHIQKEYFYKEYLQLLSGEEGDPFLFKRKLKRQNKTIQKIRGASQ